MAGRRASSASTPLAVATRASESLPTLPSSPALFGADLVLLIGGSEFAFKKFGPLRCIQCHGVDVTLDAPETNAKPLRANSERSIQRTRSTSDQPRSIPSRTGPSSTILERLPPPPHQGKSERGSELAQRSFASFRSSPSSRGSLASREKAAMGSKERRRSSSGRTDDGRTDDDVSHTAAAIFRAKLAPSPYGGRSWSLGGRDRRTEKPPIQTHTRHRNKRYSASRRPVEWFAEKIG